MPGSGFYRGIEFVRPIKVASTLITIGHLLYEIGSSKSNTRAKLNIEDRYLGNISFNLKAGIRNIRTQHVRDAISEESTLKIALNRKGIPPEVAAVSLAGASNALVSLTKCVRRLGGPDDLESLGRLGRG